MNINFRSHTSSGDWVRIWKDDWSGDQFDIMHREDFEIMQRMFQGSNMVTFTDCNGDED